MHLENIRRRKLMLDLCVILGVLCFTPAHKMPPQNNQQMVAQSDEIQLTNLDDASLSQKNDKNQDKHEHIKHKYRYSDDDRYDEESVN